MKRLYVLGLAVLVFALSYAQESAVNVYSARHYDTDVELFESFTEQTGIKVNLIEGDADELIERIRSEAANSPADVLITTDAGRLWRAEDAGLLASITSDVLSSAIPENLRHPEGQWFGLSRRARVLVYKPETVDVSDLSSYEDLAAPKWQGRICIRSSGNVYNQSLLASIIEADGPEAAEAWAQGLVDNLARSPQGGDTDQIKAVAAGECDVAVVNHYYYARLVASDQAADQEVASATALFFPNQGDRGTHVNISGAAVLEGAPNRDNAVAFLEFLVTPEAQEIFASASFEYPVLEGTELSPIVADFGDFSGDSLNVSVLGVNNPDAVRMMDRVGWQ